MSTAYTYYYYFMIAMLHCFNFRGDGEEVELDVNHAIYQLLLKQNETLNNQTLVLLQQCSMCYS